MTHNIERAEAICADRKLLKTGAQSSKVLGVCELTLASCDYDQSSAQTQTVFADTRHRETFRTRKAQIGSWPVVAVASDGPVVVRSFEGGNLRLIPSSVHAQVYLVVRYDNDVYSLRGCQVVVETPKRGHQILS